MRRGEMRKLEALMGKSYGGSIIMVDNLFLLPDNLVYY